MFFRLSVSRRQSQFIKISPFASRRELPRQSKWEQIAQIIHTAMDGLPMTNDRAATALKICAILILCATNALALSGRIIGVADGDTVKVRTRTGDVKIRLYGIDAPEKKQAFGNVSKKALNRAIRNKFVRIQEIAKDRYGRTVGIIYLQGANVNEAMIRNGMAWVYTKYCKADFCRSWKAQEQRARSSKIGLWRDKKPEPPWEWRHKGKAQNAKNKARVLATYKRYQQILSRPGPQQVAEASGEIHGNVNSRKFHGPSCRYYNCKNCTAGLASYSQAIAAGYSPCHLCGGQ